MSRVSLSGIWRALGPGLVTGAADDDPSGIATYSQAGAQFGFALLWTVFLTLPFMAAIQIISACIGWDTPQGLAPNIAKLLPSYVLYLLVASLLVANTINIAADLAAMGEALRLVIGGSSLIFACLFGVACLIAEVFIPYHRYAGILKFMTMVLLFYVAAAFSVHIPWGEVARATVMPSFSLDRGLLLRFSLRASSARPGWRCRCWRDRPLTRSPRCSICVAAWNCRPAAPSDFTLSSPPLRSAARHCSPPISIRLRCCSGPR